MNSKVLITLKRKHFFLIQKKIKSNSCENKNLNKKKSFELLNNISKNILNFNE